MLSERQMKSLLNFCEARKTTPNKLIKSKIRNYTEGFEKSVPKKYFTTHNQLDLFQEDNNTLDMFG